jgi:cell division septation protein DedD
MPGTPLPKHRAALVPLALAALLALLALTALTGCSARKPIPVHDQPRIATQPQDGALAQPAPAKAAKAAKPVAAQAKAAPSKTAEATPVQAEPSPLSQEKDVSEAPAPAGQSATAAPERQTYVQVGAFSTAINALGAVAWLKGKGYEDSRMVRVEQGQGTLFRVQAGPFQDLAAAHKALEVLKPDWPQAFIPLD